MTEDVSALPFDAAALLEGVRPWVCCESPSWDGAAVSRMVALAARDLAASGATVRSIPGVGRYGDCVFADFDPANPAPGLLMLGHLDTVHPVGTLASILPWRVADGRCYGPGLFDMKAGIFMALDAVRHLRAAGLAGALPIRFLLTSDEESGSPSTRGLIEATAQAQKIVLVPEGAQPNGALVSGRYPTCRLRLSTHGRPSHALLQKAEGRSALAAMARVILGIEALNSDAFSCTVSNAEAGQAVATVPIEAHAEVVCTSMSPDHLEAGVEAIRDLAKTIPGCRLEVTFKTRRPIWTPSAADHALGTHAVALGRTIGLDLMSEMLLGGSDGNFTGAIGVPTLDGLGPVGADAHQFTENIEVATLVPRARLLAGLMLTLR